MEYEASIIHSRKEGVKKEKTRQQECIIIHYYV